MSNAAGQNWRKAVEAAEYVRNQVICEMPRISPWISVEDKLPEEKQDVLLFFGAVEGCIGMAVGFYEIEDEIPAWYGKSDGEFYSDCWQWPTHWMPLPERPA